MGLSRFRMYVDEVGNDDLTNVNDERHRYLSLSGAIFNQDYMRDVFVPTIDKLKREFFRGDPDEKVVFHRKDILQKNGPFKILNDVDTCKEFDAELHNLIRNSDYKLITAVIDKKALLTKSHWVKNHPYHWLMEILIEKYCQFLERHNAIGDLMPEKRHGKPDQSLQIAYESVYENGTRFAAADKIKKHITSSKLKFRAKSDNIAGLELCDLVAHPSYIHVRGCQGHTVNLGEFALKVVHALEELRYDRSPYNGIVKGYGWKYFS